MTTTREAIRYQARWCEENVWHLVQEPAFAARAPRAVFIASREALCPFFAQRAGPPGEPLGWDYHVVALVRAEAPAGGWEIWDPDTRLPFPTPLRRYVAETFPDAELWPPRWQPRFRVVARDELLATFASDRSHMRDPDGTWHAEPPPWPLIATPTATMTLPTFHAVEGPGPGERLDLAGLLRAYG